MTQKRVERLQIMLNDAELAAIDEWRFKQRMPSRAAAVRAMIHFALTQHPSDDENRVQNPSEVSSKEVGVLDTAEPVKEALGTGQGIPVLLVECDTLISEGLCKVAEGMGLDVRSIVCAAEDLESQIADSPPHLCLIGKMDSLDEYRRADHLLKQARVPFVVCLWHDPDPDIVSFFNTSPVVRPPNLLEDLEAALKRFTH